ncbi:MAG: VanZ family protein [Gammaproteobacteria bacterium]|nr:VanZ family protein [Gammaproteobacteria bacterium]
MSSSELKYARGWWTLGWLVLATILILSLMPSPPKLGDVSDKWQHAFAYALLMSWFAQLASKRLRLALLLILMGIGVEVLQGLSGLRQYELLDMLANATGVVIGWMLIRVGLKYLLWLERVVAR